MFDGQVMFDGQINRGEDSAAGEFGHMTIGQSGGSDSKGDEAVLATKFASFSIA